MQQVKMTSSETGLGFAKSHQTSCAALPEADTIPTHFPQNPLWSPLFIPFSPLPWIPHANYFSF